MNTWSSLVSNGHLEGMRIAYSLARRQRRRENGASGVTNGVSNTVKIVPIGRERVIGIRISYKTHISFIYVVRACVFGSPVNFANVALYVCVCACAQCLACVSNRSVQRVSFARATAACITPAGSVHRGYVHELVHVRVCIRVSVLTVVSQIEVSSVSASRESHRSLHNTRRRSVYHMPEPIRVILCHPRRNL